MKQPNNPPMGTMYYNSDDEKMYLYDGEKWIEHPKIGGEEIEELKCFYISDPDLSPEANWIVFAKTEEDAIEGLKMWERPGIEFPENNDDLFVEEHTPIVVKKEYVVEVYEAK